MVSVRYGEMIARSSIVTSILRRRERERLNWLARPVKLTA